MSPIIQALQQIESAGYTKHDIAEMLTDILGRKVHVSRIYAWLKPGEMPRYITGDAIMELNQTINRHRRVRDNDRQEVSKKRQSNTQSHV